MAFNLAQFLFPSAGEFGTLEEVFVDDADEFAAGDGGCDVFALSHDVAAAEERFDDGGAGGGATYAVLLECVAEFLVVDGASGGFHGAEEGGFGVGLWRLCGFLRKVGAVGAALAFDEVGEYLFGFCAFFGGSCFLGRQCGAPAGFENLLAGGFEGYVGCFAEHGGGCELAVGVEDHDEATRHEVVDGAFRFGEICGGNAGGYDGVVVCHLGVVEDFFALEEFCAAEGLEECAVLCADAVEDGSALGVDVVGEVGGVYAGIGCHLFFVECLDELEGLLGGVAELFVALHL